MAPNSGMDTRSPDAVLFVSTGKQLGSIVQGQGGLVAVGVEDARRVVVFERDAVIPVPSSTEIEVFHGLGIAVAQDDAAAERLRTTAPVTDILPFHSTSTDDLDIARSLDLVAYLLISGQNPGEDPRDEQTIGGRPADLIGYPAYDSATNTVTASDAALETQPALFGVVNMSFEPPAALAPVAPGDIVQVSTWALSRAAVIVAAAGNRGSLTSRETVSAWSQVPWVIGVGSMDDEAGTVLSQRSSRGIQDHPSSGPDCVAYGASRLDPGLIGTSFAAPRVAGVAALCIAAILQLQRIAAAAAGRAEGIRLVGIAIIDTDFDRAQWFPGRARLPLDALPIVGPLPAATTLFEAVAAAGADPYFVGSPDQVRRLVLASAQPVPAFGPHEVGAGFISVDITIRWLAQLTGADWLAILGRADAVDLLGEDEPNTPLFDEAGLHALGAVVDAAMPMFACDRKTLAYQFRPTQQGDADHG